MRMGLNPMLPTWEPMLPAMLPTWYVTACNEWNAQATPRVDFIQFRNAQSPPETGLRGLTR
jgi:hypothetical protein